MVPPPIRYSSVVVIGVLFASQGFLLPARHKRLLGRLSSRVLQDSSNPRRYWVSHVGRRGLISLNLRIRGGGCLYCAVSRRGHLKPTFPGGRCLSNPDSMRLALLAIVTLPSDSSCSARHFFPSRRLLSKLRVLARRLLASRGSNGITWPSASARYFFPLLRQIRLREVLRSLSNLLVLGLRPPAGRLFRTRISKSGKRPILSSAGLIEPSSPFVWTRDFFLSFQLSADLKLASHWFFCSSIKARVL